MKKILTEIVIIHIIKKLLIYEADVLNWLDSLTSNQKVTCEFYFKRTTESDVNLYIYVEDNDHVDRTYNDKNYKLVNSYPTTDYTFKSGACDNSKGTVSCDNEKCTVTSTEKSKCRAYFDKQSTE